MSRRNGQLVTCDVCGAEAFRATTGDGEADGGYTRWNEFEPMPEGWGSHLGVVEGRARSLDLCPACNASIEARVAAAWQALEDERAG